MKHQLLLFLCLYASMANAFAQDKSNVKFGKVTPEDFKTKVYDVDSNANAVIIADIGTSDIVGNSKSSFSVQHKHYQRARILNKNGYDVADIEIHLYTNGQSEELLDRLKAVTYNLEDGKVVETKLEAKTGLFTDKVSKHWIVKKFTFPNIKEGSIIEFEYTKLSDFLFNLEPWAFQGDNPRLWSEYNVSIPAFFNYVFLSQGYRQFDIKDQKDTRRTFTVRETRGTDAAQTFNFEENVTDYRWVMKNVPSLKQESYTSTIANHISKIEFELTEQRQPLQYYRYLGTWAKLAEDLLKDDNFGQQLERDNGWLNDYTSTLVAGKENSLEKARRIFNYVQENYTCTNYNQWAMNQGLRTVAKNKNGNVAEINLLLTAMLKHEHFAADPVLLSTRSHGYVYSMYPMPDRFNYVICKLTIDGKDYFLDASKPRLGFGHLGYECYNGHARVINRDALGIDFTSDSLLETKLTSVVLLNNDKGSLEGTIQQSPGYYESYNLRSEIKEKGKEQLVTDIKKSLNGMDMEISDPVVDSLTKYDNPIALKYDVKLKPDQDIFYFNPMLGEGLKENPFKSEQRFYPVEMPYAVDETYLLRLDVPEGYIVDEMPKQIVVKLNEQGDGMFEYRLSESNGIISMRSRLRITRTFFQPDEYEMLREFFNLVVKKHAEQIVFKKKK